MAKNIDFNDTINVIKACIMLHKDPPTIEQIQIDFNEYYGSPVPYDAFGYSDLKSFLFFIPDIYLEFNREGRDTFLVYDMKSKHIFDFIQNQKRFDFIQNQKRRLNFSSEDNNNVSKRMKSSYMSYTDDDSSCVVVEFANFEHILPLFFKYQAMGDDFFVDIAENKFGCYIPDNGPMRIGNCKLNQTIQELTEGVRSSTILFDRVVVMIGHSDLIKGVSSIQKMKSDLRNLVKTLLKRRVKVTLVTLVEAVNKYYGPTIKKKMKIFNKTIMGYAKDPCYQCDVIDMGATNMATKYKKLCTVSYRDRYQVFSVNGRNLFYNKLKSKLL